MSLLSAAEFKQAFFEAEVRDILTTIGEHMTTCIEKLIDDDFGVDVTATTKEALSIVTARLTYLGYEHKIEPQHGGSWLQITTPSTRDMTGVDTTVDFFSEKEGKKRKTQA